MRASCPVHADAGADPFAARPCGAGRRSIAGSVGAALLLAGLAGTWAGEAQAAPGKTTNIAYASNAPVTGGHYRITVVNTDGVGAALNANASGAYDDVDPAWSPDGGQIAFSSTRDGNSEIYVMKADGTGVRRLTTSPRDDRYPAWSPDGTRLVFRGYTQATGGSQVLTMAPDGTGLTAVPGTFGGDQPTWSPDGSHVAFTRAVLGAVPGTVSDEEIWSAPVDGAAPPANLTASPGTSDRYPSWSPDAQSIVFRRVDQSGRGRELYSMPSSGGAVTSLTPALGPGRAGSWSTDGSALTFVSYRDAEHNQEIWIGSLDGRTVPARQITATTWDNEQPRWADVPVAASPVPPSSGGTTGVAAPAAPGGADATTVGGGPQGTNAKSLTMTLRVRKQRLGRRTAILASARCSVTCRLDVTGRARRVGAKKNLPGRLSRTRRTAPAGTWVALRLKLPSATLRSVRSALRRKRAVRVSISATARSTDGRFTPAAVRTVTLRR